MYSLASLEAFLDSLQIPNLKMHPLDYVLKTYRGLKEGLVLEFGVYSGYSISKIANSFGLGQTVYGFDSFEGLPEDWGRPDASFHKGSFTTNGQLPRVPSNVKLIKGWFNEVLPDFCQEHKGTPIRLLHVDCDIYSSTKCVFDALFEANMFQGETLIVFDELVNYPTFEKHEIKVLYEFLVEHPEFSIEFIGVHGDYKRNPIHDDGYYNQPVAIKLLQKAQDVQSD